MSEYNEELSRKERAKLCVKACKGMSDEEVETIPKIIRANVLYRESCKKDTEAMRLGAKKMLYLYNQLNEAVSLLTKTAWVSQDKNERDKLSIDIQKFITRLREGK